MPQPTISVIFPVHNEAAILTRQIKVFLSQVKVAGLKISELILVENGSTDRSWQLIKSLHRQHRFIKSLRLPRASYGQAIKAGLVATKSDYIFIFNIDFFDVNFMVNALPLLRSADIVVGSKTLAASQDLRSHFRRLLTYFFNVFLRLILNYPGTDTHGIKALKNTPLLRYSIHRSRTQNELFDTELIIRAHRWGAILTELPVTVTELRPTRYSWVRRIWLTFQDLIIAFWSKYLIPNFSERIVIGDDYGRSTEINQAIIAAAQSGIIQIISILPNKISPSQVKALPWLKSIHFSAHLNLIESQPVPPLDQIPSLINQTGQFWSLPQFLLHLFLGLINLKQVKLELNHQINHLRQLGIKISHLNSHRHAHLFPPIWNLVVKLAQSHRIPHIRSQRSIHQALKSHPEKYLLHWPIFWLLSWRFGHNRSSAKELDEIVMHPGAAYYD